MKTGLTVTLLWFISGLATAQESIESLMQSGVEKAERGDVALSIMDFRHVLSLDKNHQHAQYEIARAYFQLGDVTQAVKYARKAKRRKSEVGAEAYVLLGSVYDQRGHTKKSLRCFRKGIDIYGDYYLLWFNLGVTAAKAGRLDQAAEAYERTVASKRDYAQAHYALAGVRMRQGRISESVLPLCFFLMLEPGTELGHRAAGDLLAIWREDVHYPSGHPFLILEVKAKAGLRDERSNVERIRDLNCALFLHLATQDFSGRSDYQALHYIPFFDAIARSEHRDTFTHYILQSRSLESSEWLEQHSDQLELFFDWLDAQSL